MAAQLTLDKVLEKTARERAQAILSTLEVTSKEVD